MDKLFARQLKKATDASGKVDLDALGALVTAAYLEADRDRGRTDRSMALMIEELDRLNRRLEQQVVTRTGELRDREAQLQTQNWLFEEAIRHMSQALLMFDPCGRLVVCNKRYNEMYNLPPATTKPGATIQDLLQARKAAGSFAGDIEAYVATVQKSIAQGKTYNRNVELPDGRSVAISSIPMAEGGWVVTHEDITERRKAEKQIEHLARHDFLTGLPNRVLFRERLAQALADIPGGTSVALLFLDLDYFKNVNDTFGHQTGDELLNMIANRLRTIVGGEDTVARVGGDEFAIVQVGVRRPSETVLLAKRIREAVQAPCDLGGKVVVVDASIGIAVAPENGSEANELLRNADMALYDVKSEERGVYRFFEAEMDARMRTRRELEISLRQALAAGEFELHYQPLFNLADERVTCCEALVRWRHPTRGMVAPAEFIPIAEDIGLIGAIGEWVLREACAEAAHWPSDIKLAVNLSPTQVMNRNLGAIVVGALAAAGLPPTRLELEITESVLMRNAEPALEFLHRLRALGVRISLDDFGTGYSSLSYLRRFPFDKIKIDRSFVAGLPDDQDANAIVRAVTGLARDLAMVTTAEGVETPRQMQRLKQLGCDEMQGYLLSRPRPAAEIARLFFPHARARAAAAG